MNPQDIEQSDNQPSAQTDQSNQQDLGFGSSWTSRKGRFINKDGSFNIKRIGGGFEQYHLYHLLVEMPWTHFFTTVTLMFIGINSVFALLHLWIGIDTLTVESNGNMAEDFMNALFFSIQTFTTVGYGSISPVGIPANIVASTCSLVGLMGFALATGLFFARFSKPSAKILYSTCALVSPYQEGRAFMFRLVNQLRSDLMHVKVLVTLTWIEVQNGTPKRAFEQLKLEREEVYMLPLNWTIVHPITADSPLLSKTLGELEAADAEIVVVLEAFDKTFNQQVYSQYSYTVEDLRIGYKFEMMYHYDEEGTTVLELQKLNQIKKVPFDRSQMSDR